MSDVMIEARELTKRYGNTTALDHVTFDVRKGEVLGFLGPNGAGKTTTMKILTCFIAPTEGTAKINGADIFEDPIGARRSLGYLPESTPLYQDMLVLEYLEFVARMRGLTGEAGHARLKRAVEQTGLGDVIAKEIRALSKGYKQRVGLAQALVHEPAILILDEPMSGLDPNQAVEIRDLIREIGKERTVILSTHNLTEVTLACQRVLIVARGKLVANDTPQELAERAGKARFVVSLLPGEGGAKSESFYASARDRFAQIKGVDRVRRLEVADDSEVRFELVPSTGDDLRPEIFKAAVAGNLTLVGLGRESQNLEEIFRDLTIGAEPAADAKKSAAEAKTGAAA